MNVSLWIVLFACTFCVVFGGVFVVSEVATISRRNAAFCVLAVVLGTAIGARVVVRIFSTDVEESIQVVGQGTLIGSFPLGGTSTIPTGAKFVPGASYGVDVGTVETEEGETMGVIVAPQDLSRGNKVEVVRYVAGGETVALIARRPAGWNKPAGITGTPR